MFTFFLITLGLLTLVYVVKPLFSKEFIAYDHRDDRTIKLDALIAQKNKIYADIKDLDFEFNIGKMAEDDYRSLRKQSMAEVADVIRQIDAYGVLTEGNGKITDEYLEKLISAKRKTKSPEGEVMISTHPEILACSQCGFENNMDAKFCSECGTKLVKD